MRRGGGGQRTSENPTTTPSRPDGTANAVASVGSHLSLQKNNPLLVFPACNCTLEGGVNNLPLPPPEAVASVKKQHVSCLSSLASIAASLPDHTCPSVVTLSVENEKSALHLGFTSIISNKLRLGKHTRTCLIQLPLYHSQR